MHPALESIRQVTAGSPFEGDLWLVGGAVRDTLLGRPQKDDFDLVTRGSSSELAQLLRERGISDIEPVVYERFGTALARVRGCDIEIVTARRESYSEDSRKPEVQAASYLEDAERRDFTLNTLRQNLHTGELSDILGTGLGDLHSGLLRTPLEPSATFRDDPLRMLRAVRFRWRFGLTPVPGLYEAVAATAERLSIISSERIRDELVKMLCDASAPSAMSDLMRLGLMGQFAPELIPMVGCEQGSYHHLDVWDHTLLVLEKVGPDDLILSLAALLHDVGKPPTRFVDADGNTRFFTHEEVGRGLAVDILRRLKFPEKLVFQVARLVKNHMRLGSSPVFSAAAGRRLLRDMEEDSDRLINLVDADSRSLRPGVKALNLDPIRDQLKAVSEATPVTSLRSPLSGQEIMQIAGICAGPEVGKLKAYLLEKVLDGDLQPDDREKAKEYLELVISELPA